MKTRILTILCLALSLLAFGCEKKSGDEAAGGEATEATAEGPAEEDKAGGAEETAETDETEEEAKELEQVEVAQAGTKFEPPVQPEQLPAGAWYCDMGTTHWAATEKPEDGKCPVCGMMVKEYDPEGLAAQKEKAVDEHHHDGEEHGHGHDHDDEPHGHDDEHGHGDEHGHPH